jgi:hypothetical protein
MFRAIFSLRHRCKDQIFLTWNETADKFHQLLQDLLYNVYPNLETKINIGLKTHMLSVYLENLDGALYSRVYHDPTIPKYTLPYVLGDAKVAHSHWFRSALIRAVRYCTSVFDFQQERIYLEITCLRNGYSLEFVEQRLKHFHAQFDAISLRSNLEQNVYDKLRHRLFNFMSEQHSFSKTNRELEKNNLRISLTYLYQLGPKHTFDTMFKEILSKHLYPPSKLASVPKSKQVRCILKTKQQYSLNALLSQQKPSHPLFNEKIIGF